MFDWFSNVQVGIEQNFVRYLTSCLSSEKRPSKLSRCWRNSVIVGHDDNIFLRSSGLYLNSLPVSTQIDPAILTLKRLIQSYLRMYEEWRPTFSNKFLALKETWNNYKFWIYLQFNLLPWFLFIWKKAIESTKWYYFCQIF